MSNLKQMMKSKLEDNRGIMNEVAVAAGLSSSSALSKFLDDPAKELSDFTTLVSLVKQLLPDREYELISEYALTLDPKKQCARQAIEYADVNHLGELTDKLIYKLKEAKNSTSKEWAEVYELHRKLSTGEVSVPKGLEMLCDISIKSNEMKVFSKVMFMYQYFNKREFNRLHETIAYVNMDLFSDISSTYISSSYKCRIHMLKANAELFENNIEAARNTFKECIDMTDTVRFLAFGYMNLGNSYIFESHDKAKEYFLKAIEVCEHRDIYKYNIERSLSFLANYWSEENEYLTTTNEDIDDIQEVVFNKISLGKIDEAKEMLDTVDKSTLTKYDLAYDSYLRGLVTKDKDHFYDSIEYFKLAGDKFYRTAPLIELKKLGESDRILRLLAL